MLGGVQAQVTCTTDANCVSLGPEFRCVSSRCNLPPPIWNVDGTGLASGGQNAQIFLTGSAATNSARFGNLQIGFGNQINNLATSGTAREVAVQYQSGNQGFTVYNGGTEPRLRVDSAGNVSIAQGLNVGGATGAGAGEILASGNIQSTAGMIRGNFVASDGTVCASGQILQRSGAAWVCAALAGPCNGAVYEQPSALSRDGNRGGYLSARIECPPAMHICTTSEILESIQCGAFSGNDTNGGAPMWINNLAPSLPTPTNDCGGWTTNASASVGVVYTYNAAGGVAGTAGCNSVLKFACCQ